MRTANGPVGAPTVLLLHGWTATADLNFYAPANRSLYIDDEIPLRAQLRRRGLLDRNIPWLR